jgi:diguanylate cyclase (GGDEF)-like protein
LLYIAYAVSWVAVVRLQLIRSTHLRRCISAILDQVLPACGLYLAGSLLGPILLVPAFSGIGSGLRFGAFYAFLSAGAGAVCMTAALWLSPYWSTLPEVSVGILLVTVLLPAYAVVLAERLARERRTYQMRAAHFEAASRHDALTGLLNRTSFRDRLAALITATADEGKAGAVLMIDLDGFKAINDTAGHAAGDEALKGVAEALARCAGSDGSIARLGGDEFGVLVASSQAGLARARAEQVARELIGAISVIGEEDHDARLGASIGIYVLESPERLSAETVIHQADRLMYHAKSSGKNRFITSAVPH